MSQATNIVRDSKTNHIKSYTQNGKKVRITYITSKDGLCRWVWRVQEDDKVVYETLFDIDGLPRGYKDFR